MTAPVLTATTLVRCPHGGIGLLPASPRVRTVGVPLAIAAGPTPVTGCPAADPCTRIDWPAPLARVRSVGVALHALASPGLCVTASGRGTGPALVAQFSARVSAG